MVLRLAISIFALFLSLVLLVVGNGMLGTVVALRLEIEGFEAGISGIILALFSVGFVLGSLYSIRVIKRVGHIRAFAVFGAVATATALIHPLYISVVSWMFLRLILGFCIAGLMLITESWVNARADAKTRGMLLATYMVVFFLAAATGQFLIALGDPAYSELFIVTGVLISVSLVPLSLTRTEAPQLEESSRMDIGELWRVSELGVAGPVLSGVVLSSFSALGPIYAFQMGLETSEVAKFMGIAILAAMALQWPVGYLSDFVRRKTLLTVISILAVVTSILVVLLGALSTLWLYVLVAVFYGFVSCIYPVCLALTHDLLPQSRITVANATVLLVFGAGTIAGPVLGGVFITTAGPSGLFIFTAIAMGLLAAATFHSARYERTPDIEEQTHCVGIAPVSTHVILELDPRIDVDEYEVESRGFSND